MSAILAADEWSSILLRATPSGGTARAIDPYLVWADLTQYREFRMREGGVFKNPGILSFIVETGGAWDAKNAIDALAQISDVSIPDVYRRPLPNNKLARFFTLRMATGSPAATDESQLASLRANLIALISRPEVSRVQLGHPRGISDPAPESGATTVDLTVQKAPLAVIGMVDDFCPFAHGSVRVAGENKTRVVAMWDQTSFGQRPAPWLQPELFPYGREVGKAGLDGILALFTHGGTLEEKRCYSGAPGLGTAMDWSRFQRRRNHGAALLDLAAGTSNPRGRVEGPEGEAGDLEPLTTDAASASPIVFVQLPSEQTLISTGRWLVVNALDGIRYIHDVGRRMGPNPLGPANNAGIAINLSYGANAGAHDGTSVFEQALDELSNADDRLAIVLAAGNAYGTDVHAKRTIAPGKSGHFYCMIPPDKPFETGVEIWVKSRFGVRVSVTPPHGAPMWVDGIKPLDLLTREHGPKTITVAGLIFPEACAQSTEETMALLVTAATQLNARGQYASSGVWTISVENTTGSPIDARAWVERDDQVFFGSRGQWAHFVEDMTTLASDIAPSLGLDELEARGFAPTASYIRQSDTCSNITTGSRVFLVGSIRARDDRISEYSAEGHQGLYGPSFSAVSDVGRSLAGLQVAGNFTGAYERMNGSSVAAPQATRYIANYFARSATATASKLREDIRAAQLNGVIPSRRGPLIIPSLPLPTEDVVGPA